MDDIRKRSFLCEEISRSRHKVCKNLLVAFDTQPTHSRQNILLLDVATGLEFIHMTDVVHRNLKGVRE